MQQTGWAEWLCYVGNAKKWKADEVLTLANEDNPFWLRLHNLGRQGDGFRIRLEWEPQALAFVDVLKQAGEIPLPPYLNRPAQAADTHRYQTVFAQQPGAVAAPTASLHFTESVCSNLEANGFGFADVTLHVGAGTFKPVEAATAHCHTMHHEECGISLAQLQRLAQHTGPVVPIGTTAMRTLESLYWHALAVAQGTAEPQRLQVAQWEPYAPDGMRQPLPPASQLLAALATALQANGHSQVMGHTGLMIVPGYRPQVCHALLTNFHQPGSTLLMLVAALVGPDWKAIYDSALAEGYRFLSYGDASLLEW
jgi:S-adenosylmethionine:tRNA ribosyltransferase-isomerase